MLFSVIIPTLDRARYLGQSLAALKEEIGRRKDAEIVVVDDGSPPEMRQKNRALCEIHGARYFPLEKNRGMAVARNSGLERITGEWAVFIDDDICVEKGWGETLRNVLRAVPADVVGIEGRVVGTGGGLWDREVEVNTGGLGLTCHIIYKRETLARVGGFDEQFEHEGPFHEDQECAARVRQQGRIVFEPALCAIHLPRKIKLIGYLRDAPARIEKLLKADFYFWSKHPAAYRDFRHAKTFLGTYCAVLFKHALITFRRRSIRRIVFHPFQALMLALSCIAAQARAWALVPYFIKRALMTKKPLMVWFAAALPESSQGGVNRLMTGLSDGLKNRGIRTEIVYCRDRGASGTADVLGFSFRLMLRLLRRPFGRPDWIVGRSTDAFFCALAKRVFRLKTRIVLQNHGWEEYVYEIQKRIPASLVEHPVTWKSRLVRFPMLRATLAMADYCLCGTLDDMRWIGGRYPALRQKLRYVPNGIVPRTACHWAAQPQTPPNFLCVSAMTWRKNLAYAIALFRRLSAGNPDARLFLVGTGEIPAVLTFTEQERIVVVPSVPMEEMGQWYGKCPYFIHTARYEGGHSLALLEAMSYGAIPFVSPIPSNREIVVDRENGIVLHGTNTRRDCATIESVIHDGALTASLTRKAHATAMRNRWQRQIDRLERVLRRS
jgi:glycosyltransferase involved in cell wall biosynthesis